MGANRLRAGVALVEVIVGLVMLATTGVALLAVLGQTAQSMRSASNTERQLRLAAAELDRLVVLDRTGLLARQGWSAAGSFSIHIDAVSAELFEVGVAETDTSAVLLSTTLYRPDSPYAVR